MTNETNVPNDGSRIHLTDAAAIALMLLSLLVFCGWAFSYRALTAFAFSDNLPTMKVNTAICTMMLGMGLLSIRRQYQQLVILSAATVLIIATTALSEYSLGIKLGVNELFFNDNWSLHHPGRMSPAAAVCFALAAILLLLQKSVPQRLPILYSVLTLCCFLFPLTALHGYLASIQTLNSISLFVGYSLPTVLAMMIFLMGLIATTEGSVCILLRKSDEVTRSFKLIVICAVLASLTFASISGYGVREGTLSIHLAHAIHSSLMVLMLLFLLGISYRKMHENREATVKQHQQQRAEFKQTPQQSAILSILDVSDDGILLVDERRRIAWANRGIANIFGWTVDELLGLPLETLVPERYRNVHVGVFHQFMVSGEYSRVFDAQGKALALTKRGYEKPIIVSIHKQKITLAQGHAVIMVRELSGLETEIADLNSRVSIDRLTGLPDRVEFMRFCHKVKTQAFRKDQQFLCLMVIDLDNFKLINDRYDREFGDRVLQTVTTTLKHRLRSSDRLFRYTADSFILISVNHSPSEAELMAERMRTSVKVSPTKLDNKNVYITCTIGVYVTNARQFDIEAKAEYLIADIHATKNGEKDRVLILPGEVL